MQAYKADTAWNRGIPCIKKKRIQVYLLRLYLYPVTYCTIEAIKGNIFWILNEKVPAYEAAIFIFLFLIYCIREGLKANIFGH